MPFNQPFFWISIVSLLLITGIVSGSYPALFLSSLQPVRVLKHIQCLDQLGKLEDNNTLRGAKYTRLRTEWLRLECSLSLNSKNK